MTTTPITGGSAVSPTATNAPPKKTAADPLTSKTTFLQLLVAQLKNQNPLSPADGVQFITQLAQFSSLEQNTEMRDDLDAIRQQLTDQAAAAKPAGSTAPAPDTTKS